MNMKENGKKNCENNFEPEFHELEDEDEADIFIFGFNFLNFFYISFKDIIVKLGIKKKATIKKCHTENVIQIKCPYCHNITVQENIANYRCPYCGKKSYVDTSGGLLFLLNKKRINKV